MSDSEETRDELIELHCSHVFGILVATKQAADALRRAGDQSLVKQQAYDLYGEAEFLYAESAALADVAEFPRWSGRFLADLAETRKIMRETLARHAGSWPRK